MARIITKITKRPSDPWIMLSDASIFTADELTNVINPYFDYVKTLPGLVIQSPLPAPFLYDDTAESSMIFDTQENAISASEALFFNPTNPAVLAKNALMRKKTEDAGAVYSFNITIAD